MKKDRIIMLLLLLNLASSCGSLFEDAKATGNYQLVNLYGYRCITNYSSIWCD